MPMPTLMNYPTQHTPAGGRLVATDGRELPLQATAIRASAQGGIARVTLVQRFTNPYDVPLAVSYQVPLPPDGAVSGYAFDLGERRIVGKVDEKRRARERYEQAIVEGRSAALLEQDRSSLFTQDIGNIPARATVVAEIAIDQKLRWLAEGSWEWRFPTVVAPRYLGEEGRVKDAERVSVDVAESELSPRAELSLHIDEPLADGARPESSSHPIRVAEERGGALVSLVSERGARLDRDIVVAWRSAGERVKTQLLTARKDGTERAFGLLTVLPPRAADAKDAVARDLILLLDTSGSMHGEPLDQARRVSLALVDSLGDRDSLMMIEFSERPRDWRPSPVRCTREAKAEARTWLEKLEAGGGTEMHSGILAALAPMRADAQRQVVLISDGLIGFEDEIVGTILNRLPIGSRVHTVGVGSAVNRSLTQAAARAGRGHEAIIALGEDPERIARRLVAHTAQPLVVDLQLSGSALVAHHPAKLPDLFAGAPALVSLELDPKGGELSIRGRTGSAMWEQRIEVPSTEAGVGNAAIAALFGREAVEDLEMQRAAGDGGLDGRVLELGLGFQIATRLTSWIAVSEERTVDPTAPSRKEQIPHELPYGMSVERLGLRGMQPMAPAGFAAPMSAIAPAPVMRPPAAMAPPPPAPGYRSLSKTRLLGGPAPMPSAGPPSTEAPPAKEEGAKEKPPAVAEARRRSKPKAGIARRLVDGMRGLLGAPREMTLVGRIVVLGADRVTVEIDVPDAMSWSPSDARVVLSDGTELVVSIDDAATTRAGRVDQGQVIRLTLRWSATIANVTPLSVRLVNDSVPLAIEL